jgi:hypothetical protein
MIRKKFGAALAIVFLVSCASTIETVVASNPPADPMTVVKAGLDQVVAVFNDQRMPLSQRREKSIGTAWRNRPSVIIGAV